MNVSIRAFTTNDWKEVAEIYRKGLLTRKATFETEVPEDDIWIKKFHSNLLWVTVINGKVVGWAGLQPVSARKVYEGIAEVTVYVHPDHSGKGLGKELMMASGHCMLPFLSRTLQAFVLMFLLVSERSVTGSGLLD